MAKPLPTLDQISVASPCHVSWADMTGDDRTRFCSHCKLHVYDLSAMSREDAEQLIREREGRTCVRFFRRQDGTVLTRDCPVGLLALRRRFTRAIAALAGIVLALVSGTLFGSRINRMQTKGYRSPTEVFAHWVNPQKDVVIEWVGALTCPPINSPPIIEGQDLDLLMEPAESPLPPPTPEQLDSIQERLFQ